MKRLSQLPWAAAGFRWTTIARGVGAASTALGCDPDRPTAGQALNTTFDPRREESHPRQVSDADGAFKGILRRHRVAGVVAGRDTPLKRCASQRDTKTVGAFSHRARLSRTAALNDRSHS
jgi:hypothetical protein